MPKVKPNTNSGITLSVSPNPALVNSSYTITGTGFTETFADGLIHVSAADPGCCKGYAIRPDATGNITLTDMANGSGTYTFTFLGVNSRGNVKTLGTIVFPVA